MEIIHWQIRYATWRCRQQWWCLSTVFAISEKTDNIKRGTTVAAIYLLICGGDRYQYW